MKIRRKVGSCNHFFSPLFLFSANCSKIVVRLLCGYNMATNIYGTNTVYITL